MFGSLLLYLSFPTIVGLLSLLAIILFYKFKVQASNDGLSCIPGPKPKYPILGNVDLFRIKDIPLNISINIILQGLAKLYEDKGLFKILLGPKPIVLLFRHKTISNLLASSVNINKTGEYELLTCWLGNGLLTSKGALWKSRRRMLTPAFHFKILEDFLPIMNEQSDILVKNLLAATEQPFIDIREPIVQCTLDVICETAMGVSIGAQVGKNKDYLEAIHNLGEEVLKRIFSPWLWSDFIFYKTSAGKRFKSDLNILHSMTRKVIKQRKAEILSKKSENKTEIIDDFKDNIYASNKKKKRMAFLDLLLDYHIKDNSLSLEDIREEVDTFMFEGHDTTAVSLAWTLYLLGLHPKVQTRIQEELEMIFGTDKERDITPEDLKQMSYLECVIKESLRIFPSVPMIGRKLTEDMKSGEYLIPKETTVFIMMEHLHSDPKVFPDPLKFKPERFEANDTDNINAYSYVPFSAGARSCIGKRFALNEEKIILSKVLLNFNFQSLDERDKIICAPELIFRSKLPIRIKVLARQDTKNQ